MPVPSSISELSTTPASNSPAGSESPSTADDYLRTYAAFIKQVDDASVKTAGAQTIAGAKTFSDPIRANQITDASGGNSAVLNGVVNAPGGMGFRNRVINGDMRIDQRNNGASVTANNDVFLVDRFQMVATQASKFTAQRNAGAVTPPAGFSNYLGFTSSSAYSVLSGDIFAVRHKIEGFNVADLAWGTASAQSATVSFWVRSSLVGTFGGAVENESSNRCYPFSYSISTANTWEQKTLTIPGDTTGAWAVTNGTGMQLAFGLGVGSTSSGTAGAWGTTRFWSATGATSVVGTNGATWQVTGVQLEAGTVATPFERRSYQTELQLAMRYFQKTYNQNGVAGSTNTGQQGSIWSSVPTTNSYPNIGTWNFAVPMRIAPAVIGYNPNTGASGGFIGDSTSYTPLAITSIGDRSASFFGSNVSVGTSTFISCHATASAEL